MLNSRTIGIVFGGIFIFAGLLGFIPNPLVSPHGIFAVNLAHNFVHVLTGVIFIILVMRFKNKEDVVIKSIGAAYMAIAVVGFFTTGDKLLGFIHINEADRWLHLGLAIAIIGAGFIFKPAQSRISP